MARMTTLSQETDIIAFAEEAASFMSKNPDCHTYTRSGHILFGELLAMRWGLDGDCIMIARFDENFEPVNFQGIIRADSDSASPKNALDSLAPHQEPSHQDPPLRDYSYLGLSAAQSGGWAVIGIDDHPASQGRGVLEWCTDEKDARLMLAEMQGYPQFSNLRVCQLDCHW